MPHQVHSTSPIRPEAGRAPTWRLVLRHTFRICRRPAMSQGMHRWLRLLSQNAGPTAKRRGHGILLGGFLLKPLLHAGIGLVAAIGDDELLLLGVLLVGFSHPGHRLLLRPLASAACVARRGSRADLRPREGSSAGDPRLSPASDPPRRGHGRLRPFSARAQPAPGVNGRDGGVVVPQAGLEPTTDGL